VTQRSIRRICLIGGAGFIGGHFADRLLASEATERVTVYDNFSSGREWHLAAHQNDTRLVIIKNDARNLSCLSAAMDGHDTVIHLASNPDIGRAATEPTIDFDQGTLLTHHVAEAARCNGVETILYASGSGVYGDLGEREATEDHGPLLPISTYGASKLAGEALLASYSAMFGISVRAFRFGNVVGPRQTHGVGFDFIGRLLTNPQRLRILGDGHQSKSYIHVDDIVQAVLKAASVAEEPYTVFNVATGDYVTVSEIARIAMDVIGLPTGSTEFEYSGGHRGWKGDVPVVRINTDRIRALGWNNKLTTRQALRASMESMLLDARSGRFGTLGSFSN
jgi:UDP-glucose 4-epimerase